VAWDGTSFLAVWADAFRNVYADRLSTDLKLLDTPAVVVSTAALSRACGPFADACPEQVRPVPQLACRPDGECLVVWNQDTAETQKLNARLRDANSSWGATFELALSQAFYGAANAVAITPGPDGFLVVWEALDGAADKVTVESIFVQDDGQVASKTLLHSAYKGPPSVLWLGSDYIMTNGSDVVRLDATREVVDVKPSALQLSYPRVLSDGHGGAAVFGMSNGVELQKVSSSFEVGPLVPTFVGADHGIWRATGGYLIRGTDSSSDTLYFFSDQNDTTTIGPSTGVGMSVAFSDTAGVRLVSETTPSHGRMVDAALNAYPLTPDGQVVKDASSKPGGLVPAFAQQAQVTASSEGYVVSWDEVRYDQIERSRYVRVDRYGRVLDDEGQHFDPGNDASVLSVATSPKALMWTTPQHTVRLSDGKRSEITVPEATDSLGPKVVAASDGFLSYGELDMFTPFVQRHDSSGTPLGDPSIYGVNCAAVPPPGPCWRITDAAASGASYLLQSANHLWLLKPDSDPMLINPPFPYYQMRGSGGSFRVLPTGATGTFVTISKDGEESAIQSFTADEDLGQLLYLFSNAEQDFIVFTRSASQADNVPKIESRFAEIIGNKIMPSEPIASDDGFSVASSAPDTFLSIGSDNDPRGVMNFYARTGAPGGACQVSADCGDLVCLEGFCQPPPLASGGAGGAPAQGDAGAVDESLAGTAGASASPAGGTGSAATPPGGEPATGAGGAAGDGKASGGHVGEAAKASGGEGACDCSTPRRGSSTELLLLALTLGVANARRRRLSAPSPLT